MFSIEVEITNNTGLHARPASMFVKEASRYESEIVVVKDNEEFNAKSILCILSMGADKGSKVVIKAEGNDEQKAVKALKSLVDSKFGE